MRRVCLFAARSGLHQLFHRLVDREAGGLLPGRELFERHQHLTDNILNREGDEGAAIPPVIVVYTLITPLERVDGEVEEDWRAERGEWSSPDLDPLRLLNEEVDLEPLVTHGQQVAVVAEIEELLTLAGPLASEVVGLVVAVEVDPVGPLAGLVALEELLLDIRLSRGGQQGGQPVLPRKDLREGGPRLHRAR